jgi:folylpolyglutamate synthase/dihydropteroate synthase
MKQGQPVVLGKQPHPGAREVLLEAAKALECPLVEASDCVSLQSRGFQFNAEGLQEACSISFRDGEEEVNAGEPLAGSSSS